MARLLISDTPGQNPDTGGCPDGHGHPLKGVVRNVRNSARPLLRRMLRLSALSPHKKSNWRRHKLGRHVVKAAAALRNEPIGSEIGNSIGNSGREKRC